MTSNKETKPGGPEAGAELDNYDEKFQEMQKYIPFLEMMIQKLERSNDKSREAQLLKMKSLHSILSNTKRKLRIETLQRCEEVLQKLHDKVEKGTSSQLRVTEKKNEKKKSAETVTSKKHKDDSKETVNDQHCVTSSTDDSLEFRRNLKMPSALRANSKSVSSTTLSPMHSSEDSRDEAPSTTSNSSLDSSHPKKTDGLEQSRERLKKYLGKHLNLSPEKNLKKPEVPSHSSSTDWHYQQEPPWERRRAPPLDPRNRDPRRSDHLRMPAKDHSDSWDIEERPFSHSPKYDNSHVGWVDHKHSSSHSMWSSESDRHFNSAANYGSYAAKPLISPTSQSSVSPALHSPTGHGSFGARPNNTSPVKKILPNPPPLCNVLQHPPVAGSKPLSDADIEELLGDTTKEPEKKEEPKHKALRAKLEQEIQAVHRVGISKGGALRNLKQKDDKLKSPTKGKFELSKPIAEVQKDKSPTKTDKQKLNIKDEKERSNDSQVTGKKNYSVGAEGIKNKPNMLDLSVTKPTDPRRRIAYSPRGEENCRSINWDDKSPIIQRGKIEHYIKSPDSSVDSFGFPSQERTVATKKEGSSILSNLSKEELQKIVQENLRDLPSPPKEILETVSMNSPSPTISKPLWQSSELMSPMTAKEYNHGLPRNAPNFNTNFGAHKAPLLPTPDVSQQNPRTLSRNPNLDPRFVSKERNDPRVNSNLDPRVNSRLAPHDSNYRYTANDPFMRPHCDQGTLYSGAQQQWVGTPCYGVLSQRGIDEYMHPADGYSRHPVHSGYQGVSHEFSQFQGQNRQATWQSQPAARPGPSGNFNPTHHLDRAHVLNKGPIDPRLSSSANIGDPRLSSSSQVSPQYGSQRIQGPTPSTNPAIAAPPTRPFTGPHVRTPSIEGRSGSTVSERDPRRRSIEETERWDAQRVVRDKRDVKDPWDNKASRRISGPQNSVPTKLTDRRERTRDSRYESSSRRLTSPEDKKDKETDLVSPLNSLYGVAIVPKTGKGYGFQKFRIPKLKRPSPPKSPPPPSPPPSTTQSSEQPESSININDHKSESLPDTIADITPEESKNVPKASRDNVIASADSVSVKSEGENRSKEAVTQEWIEALIRKSFESGEGKKFFEKAKLLEKLGESLKGKKLRKIKKILESDSGSQSEEESTESTKNKKEEKFSGEKSADEDDMPIERNKKTRCRRVIESDEESSEDECLASKLKKRELSAKSKNSSDNYKKDTKKIKEEEEEEESCFEQNEEHLDFEKDREPVKKYAKRRSALELLQEDIREMFICEGVVTATGHRMCRLLKETRPGMTDDEIAKTASQAAEGEASTGDESDGSSVSKNLPKKSTKDIKPNKKNRESRQERKQKAKVKLKNELAECVLERVVENTHDREGKISIKIKKKDDSNMEETGENSPSPVTKARQKSKWKGYVLEDSDDSQSESITNKEESAKKESDLEISDASFKKGSTKLNVGSEVDETENLISLSEQGRRTRFPRVILEKADISKLGIEPSKQRKKYYDDSSSDESMAESTSSQVNIAMTRPAQKSKQNNKGKGRARGGGAKKGKKKRTKGERGESTDMESIISDQSSVTSLVPQLANWEVPSLELEKGFVFRRKFDRTKSKLLGKKIDDVIEKLKKIAESKEHSTDERDNFKLQSKSGSYQTKAHNKSAGLPKKKGRAMVSLVRNSGIHKKLKKKKSKWQLGIVSQSRKKGTQKTKVCASATETKDVNPIVTDCIDKGGENNINTDVIQGNDNELDNLKNKSEKTEEKTASKAPESLSTAKEEKAEDAKSEQLIDKKYFLDGSAKYSCKLCCTQCKAIVSHYKNNHPSSEVLISRLSEQEASSAIAETSEILERVDNSVFSTHSTESTTKKGKKQAKQFICRICDHTAAFPLSFYEHVSSHTGEYRFKCNECSFTTVSRNNLKYHFYSQHPDLSSLIGVTPVILNEGPPRNSKKVPGYLCSACNFVQLIKENTEKHIATYHTSENNVKILTISMSKILPFAQGNIENLEESNKAAALVEKSDVEHNLEKEVTKIASMEIDDQDITLLDVAKNSLQVGEENNSSIVLAGEKGKGDKQNKTDTLQMEVGHEKALDNITKDSEKAVVGSNDTSCAEVDKEQENKSEEEKDLELKDNSGNIDNNENDSEKCKDAEVEKQPATEEPPREIDLKAFVCSEDLEEENSVIQKERLKKMEEIAKNLKESLPRLLPSSQSSIIDKLSDKLKVVASKSNVDELKAKSENKPDSSTIIDEKRAIEAAQAVQNLLRAEKETTTFEDGGKNTKHTNKIQPGDSKRRITRSVSKCEDQDIDSDDDDDDDDDDDEDDDDNDSSEISFEFDDNDETPESGTQSPEILLDETLSVLKEVSPTKSSSLMFNIIERLASKIVSKTEPVDVPNEEDDASAIGSAESEQIPSVSNVAEENTSVPNVPEDTPAASIATEVNKDLNDSISKETEDAVNALISNTVEGNEAADALVSNVTQSKENLDSSASPVKDRLEAVGDKDDAVKDVIDVIDVIEDQPSPISVTENRGKNVTDSKILSREESAPILVGPLEVSRFSEGLLYSCNVRGCIFASRNRMLFAMHIENSHKVTRWDGVCKTCKNTSDEIGSYKLSHALHHLITVHLVAPPNDAAASKSGKHTKPLTHAMEVNLTEEESVPEKTSTESGEVSGNTEGMAEAPRIRLRRLSGDLLSVSKPMEVQSVEEAEKLEDQIDTDGSKLLQTEALQTIEEEGTANEDDDDLPFLRIESVVSLNPDAMATDDVHDILKAVEEPNTSKSPDKSVDSSSEVAVAGSSKSIFRILPASSDPKTLDSDIPIMSGTPSRSILKTSKSDMQLFTSPLAGVPVTLLRGKSPKSQMQMIPISPLQKSSSITLLPVQRLSSVKLGSLSPVKLQPLKSPEGTGSSAQAAHIPHSLFSLANITNPLTPVSKDQLPPGVWQGKTLPHLLPRPKFVRVEIKENRVSTKEIKMSSKTAYVDLSTLKPVRSIPIAQTTNSLSDLAITSDKIVSAMVQVPPVDNESEAVTLERPSSPYPWSVNRSKRQKRAITPPLVPSVPASDAVLQTTVQKTKLPHKPAVPPSYAKASKLPAVYEEMTTPSKLRHLYKCMSRFCSFTTDVEANFVTHYNKHESKLGRKAVEKKRGRPASNLKLSEWQQCVYCMVMHTSVNDIVDHIKKEHGNCLFQCAYCFYRSVSKSYLILHQKTCHPDDHVAVLMCRKLADLPPEVDQAIDRDGVVMPYVCEQGNCGVKFYVTGKFFNHLEKEHFQLSTYSCHVCHNKSFKPDKLVAHYKLHSCCLYQCLYCLHGTDTKEEMHHHYCNFHPNQKGIVLIREMEDNGEDDDVGALKILNLEETVTDETILILPPPLEPVLENQNVCSVSDNAHSSDLDGIVAIEDDSLVRSHENRFNSSEELISAVSAISGDAGDGVSEVFHESVGADSDKNADTNSAATAVSKNGTIVDLVILDDDDDDNDDDDQNNSQTETFQSDLDSSIGNASQNISESNFGKSKENSENLLDSNLGVAVEKTTSPLNKTIDSDVIVLDSTVDSIGEPESANQTERTKEDAPAKKQLIAKSDVEMKSVEGQILAEPLVTLKHRDPNASAKIKAAVDPLAPAKKQLIAKSDVEIKSVEGQILAEPLVTLKHRDPSMSAKIIAAVDPLKLDEPTEEPTSIESKDEPARNVVSITTAEAIALEEEKIEGTGIKGSDLYKCGYVGCTFSGEEPSKLKEHLLVCDCARVCSILSCVHCKKAFKHTPSLLEHLRTHGTLRFGCALCSFRAAVPQQMSKHLKQKHKVNNIRIVPLNPKKTNPETALFVVFPKDKGKSRGPKGTGKSDSRINNNKLTYMPEEIECLPRQAIFTKPVRCATCSYLTKVRSNMIRHMQLHLATSIPDDEPPPKAPVNPVPCLEKKEMMFDKMTNLAASSHIAANTKSETLAGNVVLTEEMEAKLPKFIPQHQRYVCGAPGCSYLTVNETMLRHHLTALHSDEVAYRCLHCDETTNLEGGQISIERMGAHLKMHDNRLYRCAHCMYYHFQRYVVERHLADKHPEKRPFVHVVREPAADPNAKPDTVAGTSAEAGSSAVPGGSKNPWQCGMCEFECATRSEVLDHTSNIHGLKSQFKCAHCNYRSSSRASFDSHFAAKHPTADGVDLIHVYRKVEASTPLSPTPKVAGVVPEMSPFDTTPLWRRDIQRIRHIRGILLEQEGDAPKPDIFHRPSTEEIDVEEPEDPVMEAGGKYGPYGKPIGNYYSCPLCIKYRSKFKADFRDHLYRELKYHKWVCTHCRLMSCSRSALQKHSQVRHDKGRKPEAIAPLTPNKDIEEWVEQVISTQISFMKIEQANSSTAPTSEPGTSGSSVKSSKTATQDPNTAATSKTLKFNCKHCNLKFALIRGLKLHIRHNHLSNSVWTCGHCGYVGKTEDSIRAHTNEAHPDLPLESSLYTKGSLIKLDDDFWKREYGLVPESANPSPSGSPVKKKPRISSLEIDNTPSVLDNVDETYNMCPHCSYFCRSASDLKYHMMRHWVQKPFKCGYCEFEGVREYEIKKHSAKLHPLLKLRIVVKPMPSEPEIRPLQRPKIQRSKLTATSSSEVVPEKIMRLDESSDEASWTDTRNDGSDEEQKSASSGIRKMFRCFYCPQRGPSLVIIHQHWQDKHKNKTVGSNGAVKYGLPFKYKEVDMEQFLAGQDMSAGRKPSLRCAYCKFRGSMKVLEEHQKNEHPDKPQDKQACFTRYICSECNFMALTVNTLKRHFEYEHQGKELQYIVKHSEEDVSSSATQGQAPSSAPASQKPVPIVVTTEKYVCSWCDEIFESEERIQMHHALLHSHLKFRYSVEKSSTHPTGLPLNIKLYGCPVCTFSNETRQVVFQHLYQHAKPYQCGYCPSTFEIPSQVRNHIILEHPDSEFRLVRLQEVEREMAKWRGEIIIRDGSNVSKLESPLRREFEKFDYMRSPSKKLCVARKSTTLPPRAKFHAVARKSTNPLPRQTASASYSEPTASSSRSISPASFPSSRSISPVYIQEFSYYGCTPAPVDKNRITAAVKLKSKRDCAMNMSLATMEKFTNMHPIVRVMDLKYEKWTSL